MKNLYYIQGVIAAFKKYGTISHDVIYPYAKGYDLSKQLKEFNNTNKVWDLFNTKEAPGSPSGFGEESSLSTV